MITTLRSRPTVAAVLTLATLVIILVMALAPAPVGATALVGTLILTSARAVRATRAQAAFERELLARTGQSAPASARWLGSFWRRLPILTMALATCVSVFPLAALALGQPPVDVLRLATEVAILWYLGATEAAELKLGRIGFLLVLLASAAAAGLAGLASGDQPSSGASALLLGLAGALIALRSLELRQLARIHDSGSLPGDHDNLHVAELGAHRARRVIIWLALAIVALSAAASLAGIAAPGIAAHLAGLAVGAGAALLLRRAGASDQTPELATASGDRHAHSHAADHSRA